MNKISEKNWKILLACMPKAGSTYASNVLASLPGSILTTWVPDFGRREQELCHEKLKTDFIKYSKYNLIAQHHVRYSDTTAKYIAEYNLSPVVLVRNIYDIVPSLIDHHKRESRIYPAAFVPDDILNWDFDRSVRFVVQMVLPWYFNFFVSWQLCPNKIVVTYEDMICNTALVINKICEYWGIKASSNDIKKAINKANQLPSRKNICLSGRGELLSEGDRLLIQRMASYYQSVDFSLIGL